MPFNIADSCMKQILFTHDKYTCATIWFTFSVDNGAIFLKGYHHASHTRITSTSFISSTSFHTWVASHSFVIFDVFDVAIL